MRVKLFFYLILIFGFGLSSAAAQTAPTNVKTISGGVVNGKATSLPKPEYPPAAKAVHASGEVKVQITIDESGNVVAASAISGHPLLRSASVEAARQAKFQPTTLAGQPVKVTGVIVYNFIPPPVPSNNEKKLLIMGLGVFLAIADLIPNDEWESPEKADLQDAPQIANELLPLTTITKETSKEKRAEVIEKVTTALENKLTGADAWQFEFGRDFGAIMLELKKANAAENKSIDEAAVKTKLLKLRDALFNAPSDFPPDVLEKFKELVKFADAPNLNSDENANRFAQLLMDTLSTISPDSVD